MDTYHYENDIKEFEQKHGKVKYSKEYVKKYLPNFKHNNIEE